MKRQFWLVSLAVILTACGSLGSLEKKSFQVSIGDTKDHVLHIMGMPADRQVHSKNEAWQYCQTGGFGESSNDYRIFWFYDGQVTGIGSYKSFVIGSCVGGIRPVRWEDAPDVSVEVRAR